MLGVVQGLGQGLAHQGRRAERDVQAGVLNHLDQGWDTPAARPDLPGQGTVVLNFAGGIGAIAELVL